VEFCFLRSFYEITVTATSQFLFRAKHVHVHTRVRGVLDAKTRGKPVATACRYEKPVRSPE
jgi:hypothetical protein